MSLIDLFMRLVRLFGWPRVLKCSMRFFWMSIRSCLALRSLCISVCSFLSSSSTLMSLKKFVWEPIEVFEMWEFFIIYLFMILRIWRSLSCCCCLSLYSIKYFSVCSFFKTISVSLRRCFSTFISVSSYLNAKNIINLYSIQVSFFILKLYWLITKFIKYFIFV